MISKQLMDELFIACDVLKAAQERVADVCTQISGEALSPLEGAKVKVLRKSKKAVAKTPGKRRGPYPRCGVEQDATSAFGIFKPVPHKDPDGLPCLKE